MVILCGFHKSGKSSIGRLLADRLGCPMFDTDRLLEVQNGVGSVRELYQGVGEHKFRELESAAIRLLPLDRQMVVATGGGALLRQSNVAELGRRGTLCFLDVGWEVLKARWDSLPSFVGSWREAEEVYWKRRALYTSYAPWRIEIADQSAEEVAQRVLERYGQ